MEVLYQLSYVGAAKDPTVDRRTVRSPVRVRNWAYGNRLMGVQVKLLTCLCTRRFCVGSTSVAIGSQTTTCARASRRSASAMWQPFVPAATSFSPPTQGHSRI